MTTATTPSSQPSRRLASTFMPGAVLRSLRTLHMERREWPLRNPSAARQLKFSIFEIQSLDGQDRSHCRCITLDCLMSIRILRSK
jgi:hypothetical protein